MQLMCKTFGMDIGRKHEIELADRRCRRVAGEVLVFLGIC